MTTQLRPVVQLLLPNSPAGKQGAAHQAGMDAQALPRAATTLCVSAPFPAEPKPRLDSDSCLSPLPRSRMIPGGR